MVYKGSHEIGLFPPTVTARAVERELGSAWFNLAIGISTLYKEIIVRRRHKIRSIVRSLIHDSDENPARHFIEGFQFHTDMEKGHLKSGGFRTELLWHENITDRKWYKSTFGFDYTYAMNAYKWKNHAYAHVRRMRRIAEEAVLTIGRLRHGKETSIGQWLNAWEIFPSFHDADQLLTMLRNERIKHTYPNDYKDKLLDAKAGHGLASAIMVMAMASRYQKAAGIVELERAKRFTKEAALMIMKHDKPEELEAAFSDYFIDPDSPQGEPRLIRKYNARDPRYTNPVEGIQNLVYDYNHNRVDLFSLSPKQLILILRETKKQKGFVTIDTPNGLYPEFEKEYRQQLEELEKDNTPIFSDISGDERSSFKLATEAMVIADEIDQIYPPYESITRSETTEKAIPRIWYAKKASAQQILDTLIDPLTGNLLPGDVEIVDPNDVSNPYNCSIRRLLWEALNNAKAAKTRKEKGLIQADGSYSLAETNHVLDIRKTNAIMRLAAIEKISESVYGSDSTFPIVAAIFNRRKNALANKAIKKAHLPKGAIEDRSPERIAELIGNQSSAFNDFLAAVLIMRNNEINQEESFLREVFEKKRNMAIESEDTRVQDLTQIKKLCHSVRRIIMDWYGITDNEYRKIIKDSGSNEYNEFYQTYDPLGGIPDILIKLPEDKFDYWMETLYGDYDYEQRRQEVEADERQFYYVSNLPVAG